MTILIHHQQNQTAGGTLDENLWVLVKLLANGAVHSSQSLAGRLGVSPQVIRYRIDQLRKRFGLGIRTIRHVGYQLTFPLEWLDPVNIRDALSSSARELLGGLCVLTSVGSTNAWLIQKTDLPRGMVCLAEHQTQGRGRQGRLWISPLSGNLYLSLSWSFPSLMAQRLASLSLAVGVMTLEILRDFGAEGLTLKWPNDLLWQGRKLGGLLLETTQAGHQIRVIVGVGINLRMTTGAGQSIDQPWVDLATILEGTLPSRNRLAAMLLNAYLPGLQNYPVEGLGGYLARWRRYDILANRPVTVRWGDSHLQGICLGISDEGALRLQTETGERQLYAGDVQVRG